MKYLIVALVTLLLMALSWATTVGLIWLIYLCFEWSFDILVATGFWLVGMLLYGIFNRSK